MHSERKQTSNSRLGGEGEDIAEELAKFKRFFVESGMQNEKLRSEKESLLTENEILRFRIS